MKATITGSMATTMPTTSLGKMRLGQTVRRRKIVTVSSLVQTALITRTNSSKTIIFLLMSKKLQQPLTETQFRCKQAILIVIRNFRIPIIPKFVLFTL